MKKTIYNCLWSCVLVVFYACKDDVTETINGRTVLVYMAADNSLSSLAGNDFEEMMEGFAEVDNDADNLIVYLDDKTKPQLIRILKNNVGKVVRQVIWTYDDQNSVDVKVMQEILSRTFNNFPAKSYGLVLWSHGDGWGPPDWKKTSRSFGQDGNDKMNISDLRNILESYHFDFILFDACFMQTVEVAYELRACSDYFIGSPTEIPGPGAPYQILVKSMFATCSTEETAIDIARNYYDFYALKYKEGQGSSNQNWTGGVSVSVVKSTELIPLAVATKNIFTQYLNREIVVDISGIMCYDPLRYPSYYYDIDSFIHSLTEDNNTDYTLWHTAFENAVPYFETTEKNYSMYGGGGMFSMKNATGLSIYIPNKNLKDINAFYATYQWYTAAGWDETELF
ncbi:Clostripain [termite gut metagenome]|uniref:Clostripain n=1 Tax=termite gut metagenome TaxID=433724 RepID=A0A5J4S2W1_9ZZZZ